jgi:hypothetical protein
MPQTPKRSGEYFKNVENHYIDTLSNLSLLSFAMGAVFILYDVKLYCHQLWLAIHQNRLQKNLV